MDRKREGRVRSSIAGLGFLLWLFSAASIPSAAAEKGKAAPKCVPCPTAELRVFATKPRSVVYIDGARVGSTPRDVDQPLVLPRAPLGKHEVTVKNGMLVWQGQAVVRPNKFNSVEADLYQEHFSLQAERLGDPGAGDVNDRIAAGEDAWTLVKRGHRLIRKRRFHEAVDVLQQALKADKESRFAYRALGICYAQLGENDRACWAYQNYRSRISPESREAGLIDEITKGCD